MERCMHNFDRYDELHYGFESESLRLLYYDLPEAYAETYASYENPRICLILDGEKAVTLNETENFHYDASEFILLPPHSRVEMSIVRHTKALALELNDHLLDKLRGPVAEELEMQLPERGYSLNRYPLNGEAQLLSEPLERIKACLTGNPADLAFLMDLAAQEMAYHVLRLEGSRSLLGPASSHPIRRAVRDIHDNLLSIHRVKDLAASYNMSAAHFTNQFKKVTGLSPLEYITNQKLMLAREMLRTKSVTETAYDLNYENLSHFIALFKRKFNQTPKQYQLDCMGKLH
ncbi:helix-turn-helix domain-containing protein [Gorillibacterium sp. CAU 1737]|uniref:helix-turn-helix domain-containing protein n=1 Tax=Gorillibacterium sp. CAU 1737 TaxID=3140362 RepID=UPI003260E7B5